MTLALDTAGPEKAPALVLLHPIATRVDVWAPLVPLFATAYRVVTVDLPGHGRSACLARNARLAEYADAVVDTLRSLGIDHAAIVGVSLGGMVAQAMALRHPEHVDALVLAHCGAKTPPAGKEAWEQRIVTSHEQGMESQVEPTLSRWLTARFAEQAPLTRAWLGDFVRTTSLAGYEAAIRCIQDLDHHETLASVPAPSLVIAGRHDVAVPLAASRAMADAMSARFVELDSGHMGSVEAASAFVEATHAFLRASLRTKPSV